MAGAKTKYTKANVNRFFRAYKKCGRLKESARAIGLSEWTMWHWYQKYPEFKARKDRIDKSRRLSLHNLAVSALQKHLEDYVYGRKDIVEIEYYDHGSIKRSSMRLNTTLVDRALARVDPKWLQGKTKDEADAVGSMTLAEFAKKMQEKHNA